MLTENVDDFFFSFYKNVKESRTKNALHTVNEVNLIGPLKMALQAKHKRQVRNLSHL